MPLPKVSLIFIYIFYMLVASFNCLYCILHIYMLFRINQHHLWTHNRSYFYLHVIPCSGVDHLIKLQTRAWTAFLYFLYLLSPSSSGSGVVHSRSSRYLLWLHLESVYLGVFEFFLSVKFATSLLALLAGYNNVL